MAAKPVATHASTNADSPVLEHSDAQSASGSDEQKLGKLGTVAHAAARGAVAAMAMTGMRRFTVSIGLVREPPPEAIFRQRARGLLKRVPRKRRPAAIELAHWAYGAQGGAAFGLLPEDIRRRPWFGPLYGLATWVAFEAALAPALGLRQAKEHRPVERLAFAADHLLYGWVLSEMRARPQD